MDAGPRRRSHRARAVTGRSTLQLASSLALAALAATLAGAMSGCGSPQTHSDLPDLATKSPKSAANKNDMTSAEQKRAIDQMIARREAQERAAREAAESR
jgi:heme A synthase